MALEQLRSLKSIFSKLLENGKITIEDIDVEDIENLSVSFSKTFHPYNYTIRTIDFEETIKKEIEYGGFFDEIFSINIQYQTKIDDDGIEWVSGYCNIDIKGILKLEHSFGDIEKYIQNFFKRASWPHG